MPIDIAELRRLSEQSWLLWRLDDIIALSNALPELLKAVEWQSMESAPKDGTACLFYSPGNRLATNNNAVDPYYRVDAFSRRWPTAKKQYPEAPYTHWMPLPLPPHGGGDVG